MMAGTGDKSGPVVEVRDLTVHLGQRDVLSGLSIDVRRGEILGIVGSSGSGKSVLLRTIIGLLPKTSGSILLFGEDTSALGVEERQRVQRRTGVMFQHGALFSSLTVRQNLQFQMRENLAISQRLMDEITDVKLEMVGLSKSDGDKLPAQLSGGMTKRVALARALVLDPEFVLLDEPTSGLDPISA
ncbi:MAG: ATP-binding cassette domain-containing protein, partial [Nitratireductor sp.]